MMWRDSDLKILDGKRAALVAALFFCAGSAWAEDPITLRSSSGELEITGHLLGFDGEYIQIASDYGPMSLTYDRVFCDGAACPDPENFVARFKVTGDASVADVLLPALWDGFSRTKGWSTQFDDIDGGVIGVATQASGDVAAVFEIASSDTGQGFDDLFNHRSNAVVATREVTPSELQVASQQGIDDFQGSERSRILALDALTPIVSPLRKTRTLSLVQLQRALLGEVTDWQAFGEQPAPLSLHLGPATSGSTQSALQHLIGEGVMPVATFHDSYAEMANAVVSDRNAIGLASFLRTGGARAVSLLDDCGFLNMTTPVGIKTEDYPLTAPIFLYVPPRIMPDVFKEFIQWTRSPAAQLIVRRTGYVDQTVVPIPLDAQGQRFANAIERAGTEVPFDELQRFVRLISDQTRLSLSFRFEAGSADLDAQSRSNLADLAFAIGDGAYDGQSLTLIGFSDGIGDAKANRDLSGARAEAVRQALLGLLGDDGLGDVELSIAAFGEALPMACDDTELGQRTNRRVELWVKG